MPSSIQLLDSHLGIQDIFHAEERPSIQESNTLAQTTLRENGIDALYQPRTTDSYIESVLTPSVGDGSLVSPAFFSAALAGSFETLKDCEISAVKSFVQGELELLLENEELLKAYTGLLIGG